MRIRSRSLILLGAVALAATGCGSEPPPASSSGPAVAGPNRRYQMKPEYQQVLGKDGKPLWKPGAKGPAGTR